MAKVASKKVGDNGVRFEFANGKTLETVLSELSDEIIGRLTLHGLSQKVGDSYASAQSVEEAYANAKTTYEQLVSGVWTVGRSSSGGIVVEALQRITGKPLETCRETVGNMTEDQLKGLRQHPAIKAEMAAIRAEREAAKAESGKATIADLKKLF